MYRAAVSTSGPCGPVEGFVRLSSVKVSYVVTVCPYFDNVILHLTFLMQVVLSQGRSQDFFKGGAEVMEAKALKKKNCL